jgi:hypothetical protein
VVVIEMVAEEEEEDHLGIVITVVGAAEVAPVCKDLTLRNGLIVWHINKDTPMTYSVKPNVSFRMPSSRVGP